MKLTNRAGLPQPIVEAIANDPYSRGQSDISITQLIAPARQVALMRTHADEIVEDASDRIYSLLGQAIHTILERANKTGIAERRLTVNILGWTVSGGMDLVTEDGTLFDYKVTTSYKFKDGAVPTEFVLQSNAYAEILRQNGEAVRSLAVCAILRDWSKLEAAQDQNYPQSQVIQRPVVMMDSIAIQAWLQERVTAHQMARIALPECTREEQWAKPTIYAVKKVGAKRAESGGLYESEALAQAHAKEKAGLYVETRPGEKTRCNFYCSARLFCQQAEKEELAQYEQVQSPDVPAPETQANDETQRNTA